MKSLTTLLALSFIFVGCDFNKSGPDERTNLEQEIPQLQDTQKLATEAEGLTHQEEEFKDLFKAPVLKVKDLKSWAQNTKEILSVFLSSRIKLLSSEAQNEINKTLINLAELISKLDSQKEDEDVPFEIQASIKSILDENGKPDFEKISLFVTLISELDILKSEFDQILTGDYDVSLEKIKDLSVRTEGLLTKIEGQFLTNLAKPLRDEVGRQKIQLAQLKKGILEFEKSGKDTITRKEIRILKSLVDHGVDLDQFMTSYNEIAGIDSQFRKVIGESPFLILSLYAWAQESRATIEGFSENWLEFLDKKDQEDIKDLTQKFERTIPLLKFAHEREIKIDQSLLEKIREEVRGQGPINWTNIDLLVEETYGKLEFKSDFSLEDLPVQNGFYVIEDEKIEITANLIRNLPVIDRVQSFEQNLARQTGLVMMEMLSKGEEMGEMGPIKKALAFKSFKKVLKETRKEIESMKDLEKTKILKQFSLYQDDLQQLRSLKEIAENDRLVEGINASRCISFFLLRQTEKSQLENCPID